MLLDQYRRIGLWLFGVSTFLLALGYTQLVPLLETSDTKWFISFVTTSGFYGVVYGGGLFLYRKLGWRVLNWRLCHHGRWHSITIVVSGENEGKILSRGKARIHQDALSIHLEGWTSASTSWKVESVTYDRQFNGVIVYMASTVQPACGFKYNVHGIGRFSRRLFTPDKPYHQNVFKKSAWWALRKSTLVRSDEPLKEVLLVFQCDEWRGESKDREAQVIYYSRERLTRVDLAALGHDSVAEVGTEQAESDPRVSELLRTRDDSPLRYRVEAAD